VVWRNLRRPSAGKWRYATAQHALTAPGKGDRRHPRWRNGCGTCSRQAPATTLRQFAHMYSDLLYSFIVGLVGAILFLLVDKYEPEGPLARLLKFLILFVAGVAILHKLKPYGPALF